MYQELLSSGLIIPFYFVCEMCEVFQLNQVQIELKWSHRIKDPWKYFEES